MKSDDTTSKQSHYTLESAYWEDIGRSLIFGSYIAVCMTFVLIYIGISTRMQGWSASYVYGGAIALVLALGSINVLLGIAKGFLLELYTPDSSLNFNQIILRRLFGIPVPPFFKKIFKHARVFIEDGELKDPNDSWVTWLGGPALLVVMDGSAVYLERGMRFSRVVGSGKVFLHRDEVVRHIVNLRPKNKNGVISAWTKDGIKVSVGVDLTCQIGIDKDRDPNDKRILPFNPIAVKQAVEATAVRFDENENKLKENRWLDLAWARLPGKIAAYIGSHNVDELLREDPEPGKTIRAFVEQKLKTELNKDLENIGVTVLDLKINKKNKVKVNPIVDQLLTENWAAERKSLAIIEEGQSKAKELRARLEKELAGAKGFEEAIGKGLEGIGNEYFAQHFSLYLRDLSNVDNPIIRAQIIERLLKSLDQFKDLTDFES